MRLAEERNGPLAYVAGLHHYSAREYELAWNEFVAATTLEPDFTPAWVGRVKTAWKLQRFVVCWKDAQEMMLASPLAGNQHLEVCNLFGCSLLQMGQIKHAECVFLNTHHMAPDAPNVGLWLSMMTQNKYHTALALTSRWMQVVPHDNAVNWMHGLSLASNERQDEGLTLCQQAVEADPHSVYPGIALARVRARCGDYSGAIKEFERATAMDPTIVCAQLQFAFLLATCPDDNVRDAALAKKRISLVLTTIPTRSLDQCQLYLVRAMAEAEMGQFTEAVATLEAAVTHGVPATLETRVISELKELFKQEKPYRYEFERNGNTQYSPEPVISLFD